MLQTLKRLLRQLARSFGLSAGRQTPEPLTDLAHQIKPGVSLENLALAESQKVGLKDIVGHAHNTRTGQGGGTIVLFTGASVTGKAGAAEALAMSLQRDLYRVDLDAVVSKYIGETEKNLDLLFDAAESAGAILFFDEADALFGKRSEVKDSHDRYANLETSYLLQRLEAYKGLAILTIDVETPRGKFVRRFHVVRFPRLPRT